MVNRFHGVSDLWDNAVEISFTLESGINIDPRLIRIHGRSETRANYTRSSIGDFPDPTTYNVLVASIDGSGVTLDDQSYYTFGYNDGANPPLLKPGKPYYLSFHFGDTWEDLTSPDPWGFWTYGFVFYNGIATAGDASISVSASGEKTGGTYSLTGFPNIPSTLLNTDFMADEIGFLYINKNDTGGTMPIDTTGSKFYFGTHKVISGKANEFLNFFDNVNFSTVITGLTNNDEYRIYPYAKYTITRKNEAPEVQYIYGDEMLATPVPAATAPSIPTNLVATNNLVEEVWVSWDGDASSYELERFNDNTLGWDIIYIGPIDYYTDLVPAGNYQYRVRGSNSGLYSDYSIIAYGTALEPLNPPSSPTGFDATDDLIGEVYITWNSDGNVIYYDLYRENDLIYSGPNTYFTDIVSPGIYQYKLKAFNDDGESSFVYTNGKSKDLPIPATPTSPVLVSRTNTTMTVSCNTPNAMIVCTQLGTESSNPMELNGLTPDTIYSFYSYIPAIPDVNQRSKDSLIVNYRTLRTKPLIPTASNITKDSMVWTSTSGSKITCTRPNGYNKVQDSGTLFTGMDSNSSYAAFAQFIEEPGHSYSEPSSITYATTLREKYGQPTLPQTEDLTPRTTRIISNATSPTGEPVYITCNGETKISGSLWTWLEPDTEYTAVAWIEEDEDYLRSDDSAILTFTTLTAFTEPDLELIGFMNDGSRAPQQLLEDNLIITSSNTSVVEIRNNQILVVGSGYCRITFEVNGKTTFTDLNIM